MTTRTTSTKTPKPSKPKHTHIWQVYPADDRYLYCACGEACRADAASGADRASLLGPSNPNPCVMRWGLGPSGKRCGTCAHLEKFQMGGTWYKCMLRDDLTHTHKSDQRVRWDACAKWELSAEAMHTAPGQSRRLRGN